MRIDKAQFTLAAHSPADFPTGGRPEVALVGRSNVGKSSLLNTLVGRNRLARISSTPGRTRAINFFLVNEHFYLVDLPGYGYAKVSKAERESWGRLMEDYFQSRAEGSWLIQLVDAKVGATPLDVEARRYFLDLGVPQDVVATKIDKVKRGARHRALEAIRRDLELGEEQVIPFSARTGEGAKQLWRAVDARLSGSTGTSPEGPVA